uniref:Zgc:113274 n=1 Tax=Seriola lalandi dorsalis TaxID=1841481 RepID=A0A3B4XFV9_SERLL
MPRTYKRKTNWGSTPLEALERAANDVKAGRSIRSVATERKIDRCTLRRYIKKREVKEVKVAGYSGTAEELADHIKKLADQFHGLTPKKCRELSLELVIRNNIPTPSNWREKSLAGNDWFKNCMARHHLSYHYIGLVDSLAGNEVRARFIRRIRGITGSKKPTFAFKENNEASVPRSDVLKKLPQPQKVGGTARREQQFVFLCNLDSWNIE